MPKGVNTTGPQPTRRPKRPARPKGGTTESVLKGWDNKRKSAQIYSAIYDSMTKDPTYLPKFLDKVLKESYKDPNSPCARMLLNSIGMDNNFMERIDRWINEAQAKDKDFEEWRLIKQLTPAQQDIFNRRQRRNLLICGRRFGKTWLIAAMIAYYSGLKGQPSLYVHKSMRNAIEQIWTPIIDFCKITGISISSQDKGSGTITFTGGGQLFIRGNDDRSSADLIRGGKYALACIDEAFFQRGDLKYLIEDVIEPAQAQYEERCTVLSSTPPRAKRKYFEKIKETWPTFTGTMKDNTSIPSAHEEFDRQKLERGSLNSWQREWEGAWIIDEESIVWHPIENITEPVGLNKIICGVDYGFNDYCAFVAIGVDSITKNKWLILEDKWNSTGAADSIERIKTNYEKVKKYAEEKGIKTTIFIEADTDQKMISYDLSTTHKLPVESAMKSDRVLQIRKLDDQLRTGRLQLIKDGYCWEECESTIWARDKDDQLTDEFDETYHPDAMMALLYAFNRICFDLGE